MDFSGPKYFQSPPVVFASNMEPRNKDFSSFADTFQDPLCKLNLKETSEFVRSLPMANNTATTEWRRREGVNSVVTQRRLVDSPSTPGRPVFSFSSSISKQGFPSKWDDAEKWLISSSSCNDSPAHNNCIIKPSPRHESLKVHKKVENYNQQVEVFAEKSRVTEERVSKLVSNFQGSVSLDQCTSGAAFSNGACVPGNVLLKDKFTNDIEPVLPNFRYSEPLKEGFFFNNSAGETMKDAGTEVLPPAKHRDVGTEMTPLGSSTTSRCHTPFKSSSPARHNTPANRSGPLALENSSSANGHPIDISQLQECHLAKLQLGTQYDSVTSNWSSREEEEEDISKSLRHFETGNACRRSVSDSRAAGWEEEEKAKCCFRYQREEAKIQAWVNLQSAKAEAKSKKLEVKIQKMRSNLEEKLMKRMAVVHRKAMEWRAAALQEHTEQLQRAAAQAKKMTTQQNSQLSSHSSCSCFPCNKHH